MFISCEKLVRREDSRVPTLTSSLLMVDLYSLVSSMLSLGWISSVWSISR